jgi:hypothetical protein
MNSEYKTYIQIALHGEILVFKTCTDLLNWLLAMYASVWLIASCDILFYVYDEV